MDDCWFFAFVIVFVMTPQIFASVERAFERRQMREAQTQVMCEILQLWGKVVTMYRGDGPWWLPTGQVPVDNNHNNNQNANRAPAR